MKKLLSILFALMLGIMVSPAPTYYFNRYSTNIDGTYITNLSATITNIGFAAFAGVVSNYNNVFGVNQTNTGNIQAASGVYKGAGVGTVGFSDSDATQTGTITAPSDFTANRTFTLPDASGTISVVNSFGITNGQTAAFNIAAGATNTSAAGWAGNGVSLTNIPLTGLTSPTNAMGNNGALDFAITTPAEVTTNIGSSSFTIGGTPTGGNQTAYNTKIVHVLSTSGSPTITVAAPWKSLGNGGSLVWTVTNRVDLIFQWQPGHFTNVTGISDATIVTGAGTALTMSGNSLNVVSTEILTNGATQNIAVGGGLTNNSAAGFNGNAAGLTNMWVMTPYFGSIQNIQLQNGNRFISPFGPSTATNLIQLVGLPLPSGGYLSNLTVRCSTNNFSTTNYTFTLLTNNAAVNPVPTPVASLLTTTLLGVTANAQTNGAGVSCILPARSATVDTFGVMQILNSVANTTQPQTFSWRMEWWHQQGNP